MSDLQIAALIGLGIFVAYVALYLAYEAAGRSIARHVTAALNHDYEQGWRS